MANKDYLGSFIDRLFNIKKQTWILLSIFSLGLILRIIAAINLSVSADDMHFVTHAVDFYKSGRLVTYDQSSGLWFAITSIFYNLFGATQLSSRLAALIFGSLTIFVVYFISKEFFDEKVAILAAFLLAIAPFHIKLTIAEQDVMAMFFVLFSMFIFIRAIKFERPYLFIASGALMGLAIYTKVYPLLFIPSLLAYFVYFNRKNKGKIQISRKDVKNISLFLFMIFIFTIPALTHNYLLYKDQGFMDLQFTRALGLGKDKSAEYYSWDHQFSAKNDWKGLVFGNSSNSGSPTPTFIQAVNYIRIGNPVIFYLGLIGILVLLFYKKERIDKSYLWFFAASIVFALPFMASIILLPKHYVFLEIFLVPFSALAIITGNKKFFKENGKTMRYIVVALLLISLLYLGIKSTGTNPHFYGKSSVGQFINFKEKSIPANSLIVADSRIYRGQINWMSLGRPYVEGSDFLNILNNQDQLPGEGVSVQVFFIECVPDDCGWGTIQDQPEFNESMELLAGAFKQGGKPVESIKEPDRSQNYYPWSEGKIGAINVYVMTLSLKKEILNYASQPKKWFLYDIGYKPIENQFDYYRPNGASGIFLDSFAHWIVTLSVFLAFLSMLYLIYLIIKI